MAVTRNKGITDISGILLLKFVHIYVLNTETMLFLRTIKMSTQKYSRKAGQVQMMPSAQDTPLNHSPLRNCKKP